MQKADAYLVKIDSYWSNYIPYSLLFLHGSLKVHGLKVKTLHNWSSKDVDESLKYFSKTIIDNKPLFVGLSVITGRCVKYSAILSKMIKDKNPDIKIVWGGIHPTLLPEECLRKDFVDFVIMDEGEHRIIQFLDILTGNKDFSKMEGIGFKHNNELVVIPPKARIEDLNSLKIFWEDFDLSEYVNFDRPFPTLSYITSRGCPYRCKFCYNLVTKNQKYRIFSEERVLTDISYLKDKYKIKGIHINDDNFFANRKRAFKILNKTNLKWFGESVISYINDDFVKAIKDNGKCYLLMCGGESGSERILNYITKKHSIEDMLVAAKLIGENNIKSSWSFMVGFPGETNKEIKCTFDFMNKINKLAKRKISKPGLFIPYPGTPLYDDALKYGFKVPEDIEEWANFERYDIENLNFPWIDVPFVKPLFIDYYTVGYRTKIINKINSTRRYFSKIVYYLVRKSICV